MLLGFLIVLLKIDSMAYKLNTVKCLAQCLAYKLKTVLNQKVK